MAAQIALIPSNNNDHIWDRTRSALLRAERGSLTVTIAALLDVSYLPVRGHSGVLEIAPG